MGFATSFMPTAGGMSGIALGAQVAGGIASTYASYRKSKGEQQGYEYQSQIARNNAQIAEWQAQDAIERGKVTSGNVRLKGAQLRGRQEAIFGSRNVALNEGSALNILADTAFMAERDARTATDNAAKEAWALREQGKGYMANAALLARRADAQSPLMDAAGTLLTTGGKVAASWYSMRDNYTAGNIRGYPAQFYDEY